MMKGLGKLKSGVRGITGLETAIILIAFVVVAAVFAYTVLSAGIFSTQKSQETVYSGLEEASGSLQLKSGVIAEDAGADLDVDTLKFVVSNSAGGGAVDLTEPTDAGGDGIPDAGSTNKMIVSYLDEGQRFVDVAWTATELGYGDGDDATASGAGAGSAPAGTASAPEVPAPEPLSPPFAQAPTAAEAARAIHRATRMPPAPLSVLSMGRKLGVPAPTCLSDKSCPDLSGFGGVSCGEVPYT
jgi:flagellin-like protein